MTRDIASPFDPRGWPSFSSCSALKWSLDATAVAAYEAAEEFSVGRLLVCDDAPQFTLVTDELALCWVHEGRHYKNLVPFHSAQHASPPARPPGRLPTGIPLVHATLVARPERPSAPPSMFRESGVPI